MSSAHTGLFAGLAATIVGMTVCYAGDAILSGSVVSAAGEKLGGVTVSAKPADGTITTTVFTDEAGDYFFPPLPAGNYRVWAQAVTFQTAKAELALPPAGRQSFVLQPIQDYVRQLPGNVMLAALPEETDQDRQGAQTFRHPRFSSEGAGGLPRARARSGRKRHAVQARTASVGRGGACRVQGVRRSARSGRRASQ